MGHIFRIILEVHVFNQGTTIEVSHSKELSDQELKHYLKLSLVGMEKWSE